jgi:hypothetical protein
MLVPTPRIATFGKNKFTMKIKVLSVVFSSAIILASCSGESGKTGSDSLKGDTTMHDSTRPIGENHLEDLLDIKDETELKAKFGADRISYDTVWGAEGNYSMGSYIDKGSNEEVQILWMDAMHRKGVSSASTRGHYDASGKYLFSNLWITASGIKIGMTVDELEKLNGKPFMLWGFGWDYGGGISNWNKGKLDEMGIRVELTEGDLTGKVSEKEYGQILGDHEISSDHPVIKKIQPRVHRISVHEETIE